MDMQRIDQKVRAKIQSNRRKAGQNPFYIICGEKLPSNQPEGHNMGQMNALCVRGCSAMHFDNERTRFICCNSDGSGSFQTLQPLPQFMTELL
jgi:hypothetical protein